MTENNGHCKPSYKTSAKDCSLLLKKNTHLFEKRAPEQFVRYYLLGRSIEIDKAVILKENVLTYYWAGSANAILRLVMQH